MLHDRIPKKILAALAVLVTTMIVAASVSYAWYYIDNSVDMDAVHGVVTFVSKYFESGNGTTNERFTALDPDDPDTESKRWGDYAFEIHTPVQLYNLAWLQYLGYFNTDSDESTDGTQVAPVYFYLSADLDMTGYILPPIGTKANPFLGSFDGNGYTISNLTVANTAERIQESSEAQLPYSMTALGKTEIEGVEIVGLFGVVGDYDGTYSYSSETNKIENVKINNITIEAQTENALAGIAAGYVNGEITQVAIADSTIKNASSASALDSTKMTDKLSDFTVVGYCEDEYKDKIDVVTTEIAEPVLEVSRASSQESGDQWGGSIDMLSLYNRVEDMEQNYATSLKYYSEKNVVKYEDGTEEVTYGETQETYDNIRNYTNENAGSATFAAHSSGWTQPYNYLLGGGEVEVSMTVNTTEYTHEEKSAVIASDGTYYLNATTTDVCVGTDESTASKWVFSGTNEGTLETYIYDETEKADKIYYLKRSGTSLTITTDESEATKWISDNNRIYTNDGEYSYFLKCDKDVSPVAWVLAEVPNRSFITDGTNYMVYSGPGTTSNTTVTGTTSESDASEWYAYEKTTGNYVISTTVDNTVYYLCNNGGELAALSGYTSDTATTWTKDDANHLYSTSLTSSDGAVYYIVYDSSNTKWTLQTGSSAKVMTNGSGTYISTSSDSSGTRTSTTTDVSQAAQWTVTSVSGGYTISTQINGTTYYLYLSDGQSQGQGGPPSDNKSIGLSSNSNISNKTWSAKTSSGKTYYYIYAYSRQGNRYYYYYLDIDSNGLKVSDTRRDYYIYSDSFNIETVYNSPSNASALSFKSSSIAMETLTLSATTAQRPTTVESSEEKGKVEVPETYLPLTAGTQSEGYAVKDTNTGYIVSGSNYKTSSWPIRSGDIRVSKYSITNIQNSYEKGSSDFSQVFTTNDSGTKAISDSNTYVKYDDSKTQFLKTLSGQSYVYGLHFMDAAIDRDDVVTIPKAVINGETYENYKVPRHSIDFNLREAGYINFFAGTYFDNNTSFFSLHQIFRDEQTQEITAIKEISQVYSTSENGKYVYLYSDGSYSSDDTRADMVFDMSWIGVNSSLASEYAKSVFYFEVPANAGEYALGSVEGSEGAYLLYLDLSTNAQEVRKQVLTEVTTITTDSYEYPKGVQVVASEDDKPKDYTSDTDSVGAAIEAGSNSETKLTRTDSSTGDTVTLTGAGTASFIGEDVDFVDSSGNKLTTTPISTTKKVIEKVTVYTYNLTTKVGAYTVTTTIDETDAEGTTKRTTAEQYTYTADGWETGDGTKVEDYSDDGHDITVGTTAVKYHYYASEDVSVTTTSQPSELTKTGISTIADTDYPAMGAEAVDKSDKIDEYVITVKSDQDITIHGDSLTDSYTAKLNDETLNEGTKIEVKASSSQ